MRKILASFLCCLFVLTSVSCKIFGYEITWDDPQPQQYEFVTEYTVEEHIQRITERTMEKYAGYLDSGIIVDFTVDIMYAFYDNDPEYFIVEFERDKPYPNLQPEEGAKYEHIVGYIQDDKYYIIEYIVGRSIYTLLGYSEAKKYFSHGNF